MNPRQSQGVAPLALLGHHASCSYAICVSYLYTAPSRCRRLPWGGLPTRTGGRLPQRWRRARRGGPTFARLHTIAGLQEATGA
jgi:hypothetical protein